MKTKIASFVGVLVLLVAAGFFLLKKKMPATVAPVESAVVTETAPVPQSEGFSQYLRSARKGYREVLAQDSKLPAECLDYFDSLQKIDFFSHFKNLSEQSFTYQMLPAVAQNCRGEYIPGFNWVQDQYLKACFPKDQNLSQEISAECNMAIFMMRATVTRMALKDKPLNEITDLSQLTDLVFSELFGRMGEGRTDFSRAKEIAKRMLELEPQLYAAHKVNVMSSLVEGFDAKENNQDASQLWAESEVALKKAREVRPNDPSLDDAEVAVRTRGMDPALTQELAQKMTTQNPNDGRGWYLLSYSEWKLGDHASSISHLKQAIALSPQNAQYPKVLQEISKPGATVDSFKGSLQIGVTNDDF